MRLARLATYFAAVAVLGCLLLALLLGVRFWIYDRFDPYLIDYDAPGVDITSEGP